MPEFEIKEVQHTPYLYSERTCSMKPEDISREMGAAFQEVYGHMAANHIQPGGPAIAAYYSHNMDTMTFRAGFVLPAGKEAAGGGGVKFDRIPAGRALHFTHKGSYATLRDDYGAMMQHLASEGLEMTFPTWELYMNDPTVTQEAELITECYQALA